MKYNIIIFPGSNCDYDAYFVAKNLMGDDVEYVWHKDTSLNDPDCIIIPGGIFLTEIIFVQVQSQNSVQLWKEVYFFC